MQNSGGGTGAWVTLLLRDIFRIALATFVVYFFADLIKPGFVTNYINLNALLLFVLASGITTIVLTEDRP